MIRHLALVGLLVVPTIAAAQHDYRNLDRGRPVITDDAYPVELGALEVMTPASFSRTDGSSDWMIEPEVMWGAFANGMVGLGAPIALVDGGGLAGLRPFAFYNFNTEMPTLPALALRLDGSVPIGSLGGDGIVGSITALVTRSFGTTRLHLNGSVGLGDVADAPLDDAPSAWSVSLGIDHTLWRQSAVLMADVQLAEPFGGGASAVLGGAGVRLQMTPGMVFDVGLVRRLSREGPDLSIRTGFTHALALTGGVE